MKELGTKVHNFDFPYSVPEGSANLLYGMIRSGKTYGATADVHDLVRRGALVYVTWPIDLEVFDERDSPVHTFVRLLTFKKRFYRVNCPANLHFINAEEGTVDGVYAFDPKRPQEYIDYLNTLNHCYLFIDEAWRVIDSYKGTNFSLEARNLILVTGHKFRTVNLVAQRPTSIHVVARGNMNRFYKFKKLASWPWVRMARLEFQDMIGETVDETVKPISKKTYWLNKKIATSYNTHFYGHLKPLHQTYVDAFDLSFKERWIAFFKSFRLKPKRLKKVGELKTEKLPF